MKTQFTGALYSPLYLAELKRRWPHRTSARTTKEVFEEMKSLIDRKIETEDTLRETILRDLMNQYFPCTDSFTILDAFDLLKTETL